MADPPRGQQSADQITHRNVRARQTIGVVRPTRVHTPASDVAAPFHVTGYSTPSTASTAVADAGSTFTRAVTVTCRRRSLSF